MNELGKLITAAQMLSDIQQGKPYRQTHPTGLIDLEATQAPPVIVNLYNQCRKDKAMLEDSNAFVTLYETTDGVSFTTQDYWRQADAFGQTLDRLEKLLTPLPITPSEVKALVEEFTTILKDSDSQSKAIAETLLKMKAECALMQTSAEKLSDDSHDKSTYSVN